MEIEDKLYNKVIKKLKFMKLILTESVNKPEVTMLQKVPLKVEIKSIKNLIKQLER